MGVITWSDGNVGPRGGKQDIVSYSQPVSDQVYGFAKIKVSFGSAKIVKTSEDGDVNLLHRGQRREQDRYHCLQWRGTD